MLNLIYGRSKSGKTTFVDNKICELVKSGEKRILFIVPDQITFETEKALLDHLGPKLSQSVLVLGFSRMCDYAFEVTGAIRKTPADDCTKALLMSVALEEIQNELNLYSDKALNPELAKLILGARKELALSGADDTKLLSAISDSEVITSNKLKDVMLASSALNALIEESFDDPDTELEAVVEIIDNRKIFEDYHIFIDSYLSFTAPEIKALEVLMTQCREMYITLSYDGISKDGFFSVSAKTASQLKRMAESAGLKVNEPYLCTYDGFYNAEDLSFLEENVFSSHKETFGKKADNTTLYKATDRYDEVDFMAREISRLIQNEGYRFNEIAVVGRDLSMYSGIIDTIFPKYNISYFADKPHDIMSKPVVKLISACFNCVLRGFDKDDVLSLLKTGLTSAENEDISVFENYIYTWQLNFSSLTKPFTSNPRGFVDEMTFEDIVTLKRAESVRALVMPQLIEFKQECADANAGEISRKLYELLLSLGAQERLSQLSDKLELWDEVAYSQEQIRLWEIICNTLDRTVEIIGDRKVSLKRYFDLFMLQLSLTDISFIPKAVDQVTVGDIERLRLGGRKCVFVIGAVEGEFPKTVPGGGLFTSGERAELSKLDVLQEADDEENLNREHYLCYYALTSASHKLFVSYPSAQLNGEVLIPSEIIRELEYILIDCNYRAKVTEDIADLLWAKEPAYELYAQRVRNTDRVTGALRDYFKEDENYKDKLTALENVLNSKSKFTIKDKAIAERLFKKDMRLSASRIEKYHMCRFSYFCQYGLRANERRKASIDAMEYGSFVHFVLEKILKSYPKNQLVTLSKDEINSDIRRIADDYAELHFGGLSGKSARFIYLFNSVVDASFVLVEHLIKELSQSSFTPVDYELDIGKDISAYRLELESGITVTVTGKVDRVDKYTHDGKNYIRIVDYKTGTKVFSLSDVIYGLNLQMLLYLSVIRSKSENRYDGEVIPAGVLYMPAFVPTLDMAADSTFEEVEAQRDKKLRMNGILLDDEAVLNAMDEGLKGLYIPVSMGTKGLKGTDNLATLEEFGAVFAHIDKLIGEMATELLAGSIDAQPAAYSYDACEWCPYSSVCIGKDINNFRGIYKLDRSEILKELGLNNDEEVAE